MHNGTASQTAQRVAAHRLEFDRVTVGYGDPVADLTLARDVAGEAEVPEGRMHEYLRARTAFFDRVVTRALDGGMTQVVVGAAGYDGRALRYAKPGVRWFEVDHPDTQRDKRDRLGRLGLPAGHVRFVAADFAADQVGDALLAGGLDRHAPALFLLEGVAVYLEIAVLDRVLAGFRSVAADGSLLAISVSSGSATSADRARFSQTVASMGEPVRSLLEAGQAVELLAQAGWQVLEPARPETGRAEPVPGRPAGSGPVPGGPAPAGRALTAGLLLARAVAMTGPGQ